jgi:hypothetical protein
MGGSASCRDARSGPSTLRDTAQDGQAEQHVLSAAVGAGSPRGSPLRPTIRFAVRRSAVIVPLDHGRTRNPGAVATGPYRAFGARLSTVLFQVPDGLRHCDPSSRRPAGTVLTTAHDEFQDPAGTPTRPHGGPRGRRGAVRDGPAGSPGTMTCGGPARSCTCVCAGDYTAAELGMGHSAGALPRSG